MASKGFYLNFLVIIESSVLYRESLIKLSDKLEWLKYLTPITLADTRSLINNNEFNIIYIFITFIVSIFISWLSIMLYNKKEFA